MRGDALHRRTFRQRPPAVLLEHAEMNEDVSLAVLGNQESETAGRVKPFDSARAMHALRQGFGGGGDKLLRQSLLSRFGTQMLHSNSLPPSSVSGNRHTHN